MSIEPLLLSVCARISSHKRSFFASVTIKSIQDETGASIQVPKIGDPGNPSVRTLQITHPNQQGANQARERIQAVLASKPSFAGGLQQEQTSITIPIPDQDVGLCIGRGGCVIKQMQQASGTRIQIPGQSSGLPTRIASVSGPKEGCEMVQKMIARIIQDQSSNAIMSGAPLDGNLPQQTQNQPPTQQQPPQQSENAYSAEWAAYHAAQAAASSQQQPSKHQNHVQQHPASYNQQPAQQQQPSQQPQHTTDTTYHEQFFRYAYYYGEPAARSHYGAWSPAPGTPNPYGVNPSGITPAPAPEPAQTASSPAAPQAAAPQAASSEARETSRRHVSNLPAWMTKKG